MTWVIEKVVSHKQQQVTSEMIPYLSTEMMLQSLWRRGQQQWRDHCCSHGLLTAATIFCEHCVSDVRITARGIRESVRHPRRSFECNPAGARQKYNTYNCTQHIRENADSKQQNFFGASTHTTNNTTQLLDTNNHDQSQSCDNDA